MKTKKSEKANLERFRGLFFQIGLVITLILVFAAFEWATALKLPVVMDDNAWDEIDETNTPITRQKVNDPVLPPPPPMPPETFKIIDDLEDIDEEPLFLPDDFDVKDYIDFVPYDDDSDEVSEDNKIFDDFHIAPKFQGKDDNAFREYIIKNIKFPDEAIQNGVDGLITVGFVVNKDGSLSDIQIERSVDPALDKEVLRVIRKSPEWKPGIRSGKLVRVKYSIAIRFRLQ